MNYYIVQTSLIRELQTKNTKKKKNDFSEIYLGIHCIMVRWCCLNDDEMCARCIN